VPVVLLAAAAAILCGVVVAAMGRGGELALFEPDRRPLDPEIMTAADVALLRPPAALWGYDRQATHVVLNMVAQTMTERDVEIATLRQQLADLQSAAQDPENWGAAGTGPAGLLPPPLPPGRPWQALRRAPPGRRPIWPPLLRRSGAISPAHDRLESSRPCVFRPPPGIAHRPNDARIGSAG
jgi:hypothetical protein